MGKEGGVSDGPFGDIKDHWQKVFNNSGGSDAAADALGGFMQQCPDGLEPISREEFYRLVRLTGGLLLVLMAFLIVLGRLVAGKLMMFFTNAIRR